MKSKFGQILEALGRAYRFIWREEITFLAGGVAFYGLLSLAPLLSGVVALVGMLAEPEILNQYIESIQVLLPAGAAIVLQSQMDAALTQAPEGLSFVAIFSLLLAVYSASRGTKSIISALNRIYGVTQRRRYWQRQLIAIAMTFMVSLGVVVMVVCVLALPAILRVLSLPEYIELSVAAVRWVFLAFLAFSGLLLILHFGPYRNPRSLTASACGALIASLLWLLGSWALSSYVTWFPSGYKVYGTLGAVVLLMLWFHVSSFAFLLGGSIAASLETVFLRKR